MHAGTSPTDGGEDPGRAPSPPADPPPITLSPGRAKRLTRGLKAARYLELLAGKRVNDGGWYDRYSQFDGVRISAAPPTRRD